MATIKNICILPAIHSYLTLPCFYNYNTVVKLNDQNYICEHMPNLTSILWNTKSVHGSETKEYSLLTPTLKIPHEASNTFSQVYEGSHNFPVSNRTVQCTTELF